jgi:hypothetical protein
MVSRNDDLVAVEVDRTVVMMSLEQGMYFGLDGVGLRIWSLLGTPHTVDELCRELGQEFDVEPDVCRDDVRVFLEELVEAGLVRVHDQAAAHTRPPAGP